MLLEHEHYYGLGMVALGLDLPLALPFFQTLMMHVVFPD